jgi:NADPH:quinone reductase-like Zn-dependent oxidoreductase
MLLHEQQLFRVPPDMTDEQAVLLEPSSVAVHAALRRLPQPDEHVLIIGAGTIGLLILQAVHALSPQTRISVQARHAFQVEQAMRLGATQILYPQDSYAGVQRATGAHLHKGMMGNTMLLGGYDVIYDTVGSKRTLSNALRWTRAGGTVVLVGVHLHLMKIDLTPIWYQEVDLIGNYGNGMETWPLNTNEHRSTFAITSDMIIQRQIFPEKLITHRFALNNYRHALTTAMNKGQSRAIKVVFDYALLPASVVPNVRAAAQQRQSLPGRAPSSSTPEVTWQPIPTPTSMVIPAPPTEVPDFTPTPLATPEEVPAPPSLASPPPFEVVPQWIAPDESTASTAPEEMQQANQAQVDENSPDTVVVRKPKYTRQRSKMQEPSEIVQADNQFQEEMAGESVTNEEASQDAGTNDTPDTQL